MLPFYYLPTQVSFSASVFYEVVEEMASLSNFYAMTYFSFVTLPKYLTF